MQGLNSAPVSFDYAYTGVPSRDTTRATAQTPDDAEAHNTRGIAYGKKGEYDLAIKDFSKAIELKPDFAEAYNNRGVAYGKKGDFDHAIADFNTVIKLNPNSPNAYNNRGVVYGLKGDFDRAITDYNTAIELNPDYTAAYTNRGATYDKKHDYDRAIEDYNKAIELNPDYAETYTNRGVAYDKKHDYDRAIEDYNKAIELNPDYAETYTNRGVAYDKKRDFDRAIGDHNTAIKLKPDYAEAYNNRGIAYLNKGDFDRAIKDFNKSIQLNSHDADVYYNRGITYSKKNEINRAIADHTKAIDLNPNYTEAYYSRGNAYREKGDLDRAIKDFTKTVELNPNYAEAYNDRGGVYGFKGEFDKTIIDCSKAIGLNPNYAIAYCNRGNTYSVIGEISHAIADYTKAIELDPNYAIAYYNRGNIYSVINNFDRAIADYTKMIEFNREFAPAYCNRGMVWLHMEEWDKARMDLTTAKDKGTDIIAIFRNVYENVEAYERRNRVKLPEDIAAMLTQRRRSRFPKTEKFLSADGTLLESPDILNLLAKLRDAGPPLSQYVQTRPAFGLRTGGSEAFVVDSATRDQLIAEHPASADILKPFLNGRDIRRWQVERPDAWLIFTYRRIEINRYPAIRKHLEKYRSALSKRAGKQKWYELPATKSDAELFTQTKLVCPNSYDHQTFAVDTDGLYCGDTCYLIPTAEAWLCGLLNSRAVEWFYSQTSNQLTGDYLRARSRYMQQIPIPDLTSGQKSQIDKIVDYLIFLQGQPTTSSGDLAHARDFIMPKYFERIIDGLVYESYLGEELHHGDKQFFKPLLDEWLPQIEEIRGDKMFALQEIFERLYERTHPIRRNLFFLDSVKSIRIIEGKA